MKGLWLQTITGVEMRPPSVSARAGAALSLVFAVVVTAFGCGGGDRGSPAPAAPTNPAATAPTTTAPGVVAASGDSWDFRAAGFEEGPIVLGTGYNPGPRFAAMNGALDISGSSVTAVLALWGGCVNDKRTSFTGTRNGTSLTMASAPVSGVTIRVTGTLSADMRSFTGTYAADGCIATEPQPLTGLRSDIGGVWRDSNLTLSITAATVPNPEKGSFALSGTASFTNCPCTPEATVSNGSRGRLVFPDITCGSKVCYMDAEVSSDSKQMRYSTCTPCGQPLTGTLVRQ